MICWFTSFGFFDRTGNRAEFARVLQPGGKLLIETMHHDGFVRNHTPPPSAVVEQRGDDLMVDVVKFDPISGRVNTDRTVIRDGSVRHPRFFVRLPTVPEFDEWPDDAGFSDRSYSNRRGEPLTYNTWRLVVVATK